jgi:hypothetical protein
MKSDITTFEYIQFFGHPCYFNKDYTIVERSRKYNIIDKDGKYLLDKWYNSIIPFSDNLLYVLDKGKVNLLNDNTFKFLYDEWFYSIGQLRNGISFVRRRRKLYKKNIPFIYVECNMIDKDGSLICKEWYNDIGVLNKDGYIIVMKYDNFVVEKDKYISSDCVWNKMDINGNLLLNEWTSHKEILFNTHIETIR